MRDLSIEGKITIYKTLTVSKMIRLGSITSVPAFIIRQLNIIKNLYLIRKKIQNKTLYFTKYLRIR